MISLRPVVKPPEAPPKAFPSKTYSDEIDKGRLARPWLAEKHQPSLLIELRQGGKAGRLLIPLLQVAAVLLPFTLP